ncbi:hypothetical protein CVT24_012064 [Panaeolus cyanescens]|uniref:Uncharacterized protein n=1 Tax=Panaeolus cyanescens TaxID=181874 RepID=A0A409VHV6_9AGAR|nr:hypothetical protein CVT24_012064 [Panaeolus cyanescens]
MESLLKNLHLDDRKSDKPIDHAATPPPTAAPAKEGGVGGLLGKLGSALDAHISHGSSAPPAAQPAPQKEVKGEGLFDKISDAIGGHNSTPTPAPPPPAPAPKSTEEKIFGKISDVLGRKSTPPPPPPPPEPKKEGLDAVFDKLGDVISGKKPTQAAPPPEPKKEGIEGLFDKIGNKITGKDEPPPPPPSLIQKVSEVVIKTDDKPVEKPSGLGNKLNHALGGGAKGEAEEGRLDKAIDLFQEYVLKEGPQHHESAIEQAKDKKIADTLRNTLGIDKKN